MSSPDLVYTTYIRSTPQKVWDAITNPEFSRQYWGQENVSDWEKGSKWQHVSGNDKSILVTGEVLESVPLKLLVLSWASPSDLSDKSRVTFEIEAIEDMVRLNVVHGDFIAGSIMATRVSGGWPRVLSSMKSMLETGNALNTWACWDNNCHEN